MASGKETPRQKMINLMYLVFIAMLALNMSKEVLQAFGMITEQTQDNTELLEKRVISFKTAIDLAVQDTVEGFDKNFKITADSIQIISDDFDNYISRLIPAAEEKTIRIKKTGKDSIINDYEVMDKSDYYNNLWFSNSDGKLTNASNLDKNDKPLGDISGEEFIKKMLDFRTKFSNLIINFSPDSDPNFKIIKSNDSLKKLGEADNKLGGFKTGKGGTYADIIKAVNDIFSTDPVTNREGQSKTWLQYHFFNFPQVASTTKLALLQSNIRSAQAEVYSAMLGGQFKLNATLANFDAYVVADRSSYYTGTNFTGKIVLGKKSDDLKPKSALINDINILDNANAINSDGSINLDFRAGRLGTNTISGNVVFMEDGKEILIPVKQEYEVVNKPKSASISADKMRVVYRGVENPLSVSVAGVNDNNVKVSAPGIKKISTSSYMLDLKEVPESLIGETEVSISVLANLEGDESIRDSALFRILALPTPVGTLNGGEGEIDATKEELSSGKLSVRFDADFAYELPLRIASFVIDVPGQPTLPVRGSRLTEDARNLISGVRTGSTITIKEIKVRANGTQVPIKNARPLIIKIIE